MGSGWEKGVMGEGKLGVWWSYGQLMIQVVWGRKRVW